MTGYKRDTVFRIVPQAGRERLIICNQAFSDAGSETKAEVTYKPEAESRDDVNHRHVPVLFGYRPEVKFEFFIGTMEDHENLAAIAQSLMDPSVDVFLSLDGRITEREVVLVTPPSPKATKNKTVGGATFDLGVSCVELIDRIPAMATDPGIGREVIVNGDFETWDDTTHPRGYFIENPTGTVNKETVQQRSGSACLRFDRTGPTTNLDVYQYPNANLIVPGAWYRASAWTKASVAMAQGTELLAAITGRRLLYLRGDGSWGTYDGSGVRAATTSWAQINVGEVRIPYDYAAPMDGLGLFVNARNSTNGQSVYFDDFSFFGPIVPSGVAAW